MLDDKVALTRHITALNALIDDMRVNGNHQKSIPLSDGKLVRRSGGKWCYAFSARSAGWIQTDTELTLEISGSEFQCDLISADSSQLQLAVDGSAALSRFSEQPRSTTSLLPPQDLAQKSKDALSKHVRS